MPTVLTVRIQDAARSPALTTLCAGYELQAWRATDLVDDLFSRHLASFALSYTDYRRIDGDTAAKLLRRAAETVYSTDKYKRRGEFGELILHAAVIDFFGALPAVSKIYYKDSDNDTVKGFDSVHIVPVGEQIELWLGEAKFYTDASSAARAAADSIGEHLERDFLKREFAAITNKIDPAWPEAQRVSDLIDSANSLDEIATSITMPVLLTYDSTAVDTWDRVSPEYISDLEQEAVSIWETFTGAMTTNSLPITLQLILVPLESKDRLQNLMHEKLRVWQHI
jgi:Cap4 SAVED domain